MKNIITFLKDSKLAVEWRDSQGFYYSVLVLVE